MRAAYPFLFESLSGRFYMEWEEGALLRLYSTDEPEEIPEELLRERDSFSEMVYREMLEYFSGKRREFEIPLRLIGTDFQCKVWMELAKIPYGETISYGELAKRIGKPKAARAVGMANHQNPLQFLLPCHRVIGRDGSLTGYAGGLELKKSLLEMEKRVIGNEIQNK